MRKPIEKQLAVAGDKREEPKKESTPKVRNAGYFLFVKTPEGHYIEESSYDNPKAFKQGVKEKAEALEEATSIPNWYRFRGKFDPVGVERIKGVKVKL